MASRAKTSFLSEMSHDIRTPMGAIIGMTDIALMQKDIPGRVSECLHKIKTASGHMMSLLNEVLDMSRIESGKILLQPQPADIKKTREYTRSPIWLKGCSVSVRESDSRSPINVSSGAPSGHTRIANGLRYINLYSMPSLQ